MVCKVYWVVHTLYLVVCKLYLAYPLGLQYIWDVQCTKRYVQQVVSCVDLFTLQTLCQVLEDICILLPAVMDVHWIVIVWTAQWDVVTISFSIILFVMAALRRNQKHNQSQAITRPRSLILIETPYLCSWRYWQESKLQRFFRFIVWMQEYLISDLGWTQSYIYSNLYLNTKFSHIITSIDISWLQLFAWLVFPQSFSSKTNQTDWSRASLLLGTGWGKMSGDC